MSADESKFKTKICCIGAGYVGGPTMATIAKFCPDVKVHVVDINPKASCSMEFRQITDLRAWPRRMCKASEGKNLFFSTKINEAICECEIIFVSVNTPTKTYGIGAGRAADLKNWELAARNIAKVANGPKIIVEKSTLPVRTAHSMRKVLEANERKIKFEVLSNPEFLAEGTAMSDLAKPDRVLIGGMRTEAGEKAVRKLCEVYEHWVPKANVITTNLWSSELSKLVANAFLAQRISSINSISELCEATGADVQEVSNAIGKDSRIGKRFLNASVGFGGSCFQKDILNLVYLCESFGLHEVAAYWDQVVKINDHQKLRFARKMIKNMFNTISGKKIVLFGFAFKKDTGDTRETASVYVAKHLLAERALVTIYDPKVDEEQIKDDFNYYKALTPGKEFKDCVTVAKDPYEAVKDAHAIAIMTEWDEFKKYDYKKMYDSMVKPAFIFDGRLILDHKQLLDIGFELYAIGKPYGVKYQNMDDLKVN